MKIEKITILGKRPFDAGEPLKLDPGQAVYLWINENEKTLTIGCPKCGQECSLSDHKITWHDEFTVTVEPSVVHDMMVPDTGFFKIEDALDGTVKKDLAKQKERPCGAHFFIKENRIEWV